MKSRRPGLAEALVILVTALVTTGALLAPAASLAAANPCLSAQVLLGEIDLGLAKLVERAPYTDLRAYRELSAEVVEGYRRQGELSRLQFQKLAWNWHELPEQHEQEAQAMSRILAEHPNIRRIGTASEPAYLGRTHGGSGMVVQQRVGGRTEYIRTSTTQYTRGGILRQWATQKLAERLDVRSVVRGEFAVIESGVSPLRKFKEAPAIIVPEVPGKNPPEQSVTELAAYLDTHCDRVDLADTQAFEFLVSSTDLHPRNFNLTPAGFLYLYDHDKLFNTELFSYVPWPLGNVLPKRYSKKFIERLSAFTEVEIRAALKGMITDRQIEVTLFRRRMLLLDARNKASYFSPEEVARSVQARGAEPRPAVPVPSYAELETSYRTSLDAMSGRRMETADFSKLADLYDQARVLGYRALAHEIHLTLSNVEISHNLSGWGILSKDDVKKWIEMHQEVEKTP